MANEIIENITPDYITNEGWTPKRINYAFDIPVALAITQILIVSEFTGREGEAIAVSGVNIVKVDSAGVATAIVAGDNLNGYRIGYQATAAVAKGDTISETLDYYSAI